MRSRAGYEFKERKTEKEAHEAVKAHRTDYLKTMAGLSALLNDAEYFAAFRVVQAFNLGPERDRPTKEAYEKARDTMKRMAKEKGLESLSKCACRLDALPIPSDFITLVSIPDSRPRQREPHPATVRAHAIRER